MSIEFKKDYTFLIIGIFSLLILSTLALTIHISRTNQNNYKYLNILKKLEITNKNIDILLSKKLQYVDSIDIGKNRLNIENNLRRMDNYIDFLNKEELKIKFDTLKKEYRKKSQILSWFQFHNERVIKSVEELLKLQKKLQRRYYFSDIFIYVNNSLVSLLHLAQNRNKNLENNIKSLEALNDLYKLTDSDLVDFIKNMKQSYADLKQISSMSTEAKNINLSVILKQFENQLVSYYTESQNQQKIISYILIFFSLLFLLVIVIAHLANKKIYLSLIKQTSKLKTAQKITHISNIEIEWVKNTIQLSTELGNILKIFDKKYITYEDFLHFIQKNQRNLFHNDLKNSIKLKKDFYMENKIIDSNQTIKYISTRFQHKYKDDGKLYLSIGTIQDITEITKSKDKVRYMAYHDLLTGLLNKEGFLEKAKTVIDIAKIDKRDASLISLDIDRFKDINETLGHETGDKVLRVVAKRIEETIEADSVLARFGGDEFFLLLNSYSSITTICKKLLHTLSQPMQIDNYKLNITSSIGIATYPKHGNSIYDILKNSDAAMYLAKSKNRNRYEFYTKNISKKIDERLKIENELKGAIKNRDFTLAYQPQISIKNGEIVAAEALIRWNSKELGFVPPNIFIPISEDSGQIVEIGNWVFENACREFIKWKKQGLHIKHIAINVSSIQLAQKDIVQSFKEILQKVGVKAQEVEIEITERFLVQDTIKNLEILNELRNVGFEISIDDFGTGYSSLNYLKKFPINTLKIDKSFIDNIETNRDDKAIVETIILLAEKLNCKIVAEGIEHKNQEKILLSFGDILCQGYLYSKPINSDDFGELLSNVMRN